MPASNHPVQRIFGYSSATPEIIAAISTDYTIYYKGTSKRYGDDPVGYMRQLVEDAGIVKQHFIHDPSKWDL
jgi:hypothetical protein